MLNRRLCWTFSVALHFCWTRFPNLKHSCSLLRTCECMFLSHDGCCLGLKQCSFFVSTSVEKPSLMSQVLYWSTLHDLNRTFEMKHSLVLCGQRRTCPRPAVYNEQLQPYDQHCCPSELKLFLCKRQSHQTVVYI